MDSTRLILLSYLSVEVVFYLVFTFYLVPRANQRTQPRVYRDYGNDRHKLLIRILERMERTCRVINQNIRPILQGFLEQWFHHHHTTAVKDDSIHPPPLQRISLSTTSMTSSPEASDEEDFKDWTMEGLGKQDADTFLSWAFFGKHHHELTAGEHDEMDKIFDVLREKYNLVFREGKSATKTARLLTLENVNPLHRPLLLYVMISTFKFLGGIVLRFVGFRRHVAKTGLVYWYRGCNSSQRLPLLFFHGIAPGGLTCYLPMVLAGIGMEGRSCFLFENRGISCALGFDALSEDETVNGVLEALATHEAGQPSLSLVGHSFGSCPITWLLHSPLKNRIRQLVLLDPVTILLSEPDVMNNFLYSRQQVHPAMKGLTWEMLHQYVGRTKIRLLASSELFTEYYLRRHFSWYNSELWLDDLPSDCKVSVCLAEKDEIIHAPKIKQEVLLHNHQERGSIRLIYWEGVGHARCVTSVREWVQIRNMMLEQENALNKSKTC